MENNDLLEWLKANAGPTLKIRLINETIIDKDVYDVNELADELLQRSVL